MNILVCEDNTMIIRAIEYKLLRDGFTILSASNPSQIEPLTSKNEIALFIISLQFANNTGINLIKRIRQDLQKTAPILALSKIGNEDIIMQAFNNGADDYITKPFSPSELSIRVKRLLKN